MVDFRLVSFLNPPEGATSLDIQAFLFFDFAWAKNSFYDEGALLVDFLFRMWTLH